MAKQKPETESSPLTRVVYAKICGNCESCISETVVELSYYEVAEKLKDKNTFWFYSDKTHKAFFRFVTEGRCNCC